MIVQENQIDNEDYAYGMEQYDLTREELAAFEQRQDAENREMDKKGLTVTFRGPFDPAFFD